MRKEGSEKRKRGRRRPKRRGRKKSTAAGVGRKLGRYAGRLLSLWRQESIEKAFIWRPWRQPCVSAWP